jgi:hypothetical protein
MPVRFRDLKRALAAFGVEVRDSPGGGSHYHAVKDGRTFPITAHNGLKSELPDGYVRGVCATFGIDPKELRKKL